MSDANVSLIQHLYGAYQRGDFETVLAGLDAAVDWRVVGQRQHHPAMGEWPGHEGASAFFKTIGDTVDFLEFTPRDFYADRDKVFVLGHYAFTDKATRKPVETDWVHVFTVADGRVTAFREFTDTAQIAAARVA